MSEVAEATEVEVPKPIVPASLKRREGPRSLQNNADHFQIAEYMGAEFAAKIPIGVSFEEVMEPVYWAQIAKPWFAANPVTREPDKSGSLIHLRTEDNAWYALVYVLAVLEKGLVLKPIIEPVQLQKDGFIECNYDIKWNVGKRGFDIIRKIDFAVVANVKTKQQANDWVIRGGE